MSIPNQLPNAVSVLRIVLLPVWVMCAEAGNRAAERGEPGKHFVAAALGTLAAIGVSDVVDGQLARRFGVQSRTGAMLDAVADKLAQVVLFTYLALRVGPAFAPVPPWFLAILIARDGSLLGGYLLLRSRNGRVDVVHRTHGKAASLFLFVLLLLLSAGVGGDVMSLPLLGAAALVLVSTGLYLRDGWRQWRSHSSGPA